MTDERDTARFRQAAALLPTRLRQLTAGLDRESRGRAEELRLRTGRPMTVVFPEGERPLSGEPVTQRELYAVLETATQASAHAALERVRSGFFTVQGGHRIGICGTAVVRDGQVTTLREISSLSLRIARAVVGQAETLLPQLLEGERLKVLPELARPPCCGTWSAPSPTGRGAVPPCGWGWRTSGGSWPACAGGSPSSPWGAAPTCRTAAPRGRGC